MFRYQDEGDLSTRPKHGRRRKTTLDEDFGLIKATIKNPDLIASNYARLEGKSILIRSSTLAQLKQTTFRRATNSEITLHPRHWYIS